MKAEYIISITFQLLLNPKKQYFEKVVFEIPAPIKRKFYVKGRKSHTMLLLLNPALPCSNISTLLSLIISGV